MNTDKAIEKLYGSGIEIYGPYLRPDGRKHLVLIKRNSVGAISERRTISYPKFLMEVRLGRHLLADETVDHIDGDKTNDREDNLQILSRAENARKSANPEPIMNYSRSDAGRAASALRLMGDGNPQRKLSDDDVRAIRHDSHYGMYRTSELMAIYGVTRKTITSCVAGIIYSHIPDEFFDI